MNPSPALRYRPDVDGLRALAVLSVVAYHVGVPGFGGGFVGVDVFFVISGYLITSLLANELARTGSIDLLAFYARRCRRLLPAFVLVVMVTLVLGAIYLVPVDKEQQRLARSAMASAVYASNIYFSREGGGYFDSSSDLYPLLHTWSLAVEEQFYLIWPVLLIGIAALSQRMASNPIRLAVVFLGVIFIGSLMFSWWTSVASEAWARSGFFGLPSRAWELAAGGLLAIGLVRTPLVPKPVLATGLCVSGLLCIGAAVHFFNDKMAFPGFVAVLPVAGAACVILAGAFAPQSWCTRLLSVQPLVWIGLVSYSWYLWHWPLLAISRAHNLGQADIWRDTAIACLALVLAAITYRVVEKPIREKRLLPKLTPAPVLTASAAASVIVAASAFLLNARAGGLMQSFEFARLAEARSNWGWNHEKCHVERTEFERTLPPQADCLKKPAQNASGTIVLWGDSHAEHYAGLLEQIGQTAHWGTLSRTMTRCPPLLDTVLYDDGTPIATCERFNRAVLAEISDLKREGTLSGVVLSARWTYYLGLTIQGASSGNFITVPGADPTSEGATAAITRGLKLLLNALSENGIPVVVVASSPEQRVATPTCLARHSVDFCSISFADASRFRAIAYDAVASALTFRTTRLWDPFASLCDEEKCAVEQAGVVMYRDHDHLSYAGSAKLASRFTHEAAWFARMAGKIRPERRADRVNGRLAAARPH